MKILIVTNMFPYKDMDYFGNFLELEYKFMKSQGEKVDLLFLNGRENKLNYLIGLNRFLKVYKDYDIIHFHHSYIAWYAFFIRGNRGIKKIMTIHEGGNINIKNNEIFPAYGHGRKAFIEKIFSIFDIRTKIFNQMDHLILTRYSDNTLYYKNMKITNNPMGIDFNNFRIIDKNKAKESLGIPVNDILLLFPHEPRIEKNVDLFDNVVDELQKKISKKIHVIYGGKISTKEMYIYLNAADICYLTSKFEASPTIVKESLACGTPILCSRVGDLEELLSSGLEFLICDNKDQFVQMSEKLLNVPMDGTKLREFLFDKGISYELTSKKVIGIYKELLK
ncbi:glycosyltransferase family 4 protein [Bacillus sp. KH172YL63]|uniref:glycosyltransferase family 4 protein n=1 Tax=Bacillus sp. KH172YL63 TaxID=2709784 RepID=UPI0013E4C289|nr:glycosyltransferase family 4 protein [Bacillus sp. KH172YL63]BCB05867.1 hypothetical protein KH172YL63_40000 [Bacillus sp. KH172YL63]